MREPEETDKGMGKIPDCFLSSEQHRPEDIPDEASDKLFPALPDPLCILLVGEGNLSFTYALVKRLSRSAAVRRATSSSAASDVWRPGSVVKVITTTFDSPQDIQSKYPEAVRFLDYFSTKQRVSVRYYGGVNATSLLAAPVSLRDHPFHLLVFNNPHIGFEDLYRQRSLLSHFFHSARELYHASPIPAYPQEILVTLCDDQARRWDLLGCAARSGYICVAAVLLRPADFPEYINRRHQSDAAFPFRTMVQYYFVLYQAELKEVLLRLFAEVSSWAPKQASSASARLPRGDFSEWLGIALSTLNASAEFTDEKAELRECVLTDTLAPSYEDLSVNNSSTFAQQPLPLLHPSLVARVVARVVLGPHLSDTPVERAEVFMPYLPSTSWVSLYRAQRLAEANRSACDPAPAAGASSIPPHLDTSILGRTLTLKEAKKLKRYLSGYGAVMKEKAEQRSSAATEVSSSWICDVCQPHRPFHTEDDLRQHQIAKHTRSSTPLAPTLYARVHRQIEVPRDSLEVALNAMQLGESTAAGYCNICGLHFTTCDAYEEHLRYLSPLPGDAAADLVCNQCQPQRPFTDRRALEQHRAAKHEPPV